MIVYVEDSGKYIYCTLSYAMLHMLEKLYIYIYMYGFSPLSFKKYNKLDEWIYSTYFYIIPIILLNNFLYSLKKTFYIIKIVVSAIKKRI